MTGAVLRSEGVALSFGPTRAVEGVDLSVDSGELVVLLGPSGCGKTTLLRLLAGFERPDAGSIRLRSEVVAGPGRFTPPERRNVGMVFQDYALFPHLDVTANVGYALGRRPDARRVEEVLGLVGLDGLGTRRPHELSGGQQQRVALARALAPRPPLVLLDEPFSNLDASLRRRVRHEVRDILRAAGASGLLVTHHQEEALSVGDRVVVMRDGRIVQAGTPEAVYLQPASRWVARFLGDVEVLPGEALGGAARCALGTVPAPGSADGPVEVLLRPESIVVCDEPDGVAASVVDREYFGHDQLVVLELEDGSRVRTRAVGQPARRPGDRVALRLDGPAVVLPAATGAPVPSRAP